MDISGQGFYILWSIVAIIISVIILLFNKKFLYLMEIFFNNLYKRTNLTLFKKMADQANDEITKIVSIVVGIFFIIQAIRLIINAV